MKKQEVVCVCCVQRLTCTATVQAFSPLVSTGTLQAQSHHLPAEKSHGPARLLHQPPSLPRQGGLLKALNPPLCYSASPRGTVGFPGNFHKAEWYLLKTKAFCRKSQPQTMNTQAVHPGGQVPSPCWVDSPDNRSWPSSFLSAHLTSQSPPSRNRD